MIFYINIEISNIIENAEISSNIDNNYSYLDLEYLNFLLEDILAKANRNTDIDNFNITKYNLQKLLNISSPIVFLELYSIENDPFTIFRCDILNDDKCILGELASFIEFIFSDFNLENRFVDYVRILIPIDGKALLNQTYCKNYYQIYDAYKYRIDDFSEVIKNILMENTFSNIRINSKPYVPEDIVELSFDSNEDIETNNLIDKKNYFDIEQFFDNFNEISFLY